MSDISTPGSNLCRNACDTYLGHLTSARCRPSQFDVHPLGAVPPSVAIRVASRPISSVRASPSRARAASVFAASASDDRGRRIENERWKMCGGCARRRREQGRGGGGGESRRRRATAAAIPNRCWRPARLCCARIGFSDWQAGGQTTYTCQRRACPPRSMLA